MKKTLTIFIIIVWAFTANAQRDRTPNGESSFEISFGPSTLLIGDIGTAFNEKYFFDTNSPYHESYKLINSYFSFGFHQEINDKLSYKITVQTSAYERPNPDINNNHFISDIFMFTARGEYNLFRNIRSHESLIYIHAGVGITYLNYTLNPLPTSTLDPISITAPVVPAGLGYRFHLTDKFKIGAEINVQYIFNDLVEGRGESTGMWPHDILLSTGVTLSYVIIESNKKSDRCRCEWY